MDSDPTHDAASSRPRGSAIYFDGTSSRRHAVTLGLFSDRLEIKADGQTLAAWAYGDIRRADSPSGTLRLTCLTAPALARLEIRETAVAAELVSRCNRVDENSPGHGGIARIVGWSIATAASIVGVVGFGVPL